MPVSIAYTRKIIGESAVDAYVNAHFRRLSKEDCRGIVAYIVMPVSFAYPREIVEELELDVYGKAYFCRVTSVLQMGLSASLNLTHERRHVSGSSAKGTVG